MNKYILLFLFFIGTPTWMMAQGKYCLSYSDYMSNNWTPLEVLFVEGRSNSQQFWNGGAEFKPMTGMKEVDKILKKKALFAVCKDTLYVNCRSLRYEGCRFGNWYAPGFRLGDDRICFICTKIGVKETGVASAGMMFGLIGAAIVTSNQLKHKSCYVISSDGGDVERIDRYFMEMLLEAKPSLLDAYNLLDKKEKESAEVVIRFLDALKLLKSY